VAAAFAVTMLGTTLPTPLYDLYQQSLGFAPVMITVIFAVYAVGVLAALVLFGHASDELGRRAVLLLGLACAALSAGAFLFAHGLPLLFAGRALSGLSAGMFTGTATATLADVAGEGRGRRAALVATASNMGGLGLGPLLAGLLAQFAPLPLRLPFWVDLGLVLLAALAVWSIPETVAVPGRPRLRVSRPELPAQVRPVFMGATIATFAGAAVLSPFTAVAPTFLLDLLHDGDHLLSGAVVFTLFAASALGQVLLTRRLGRRALVTGCVLLVIGMGLLAAGLAATSLALLLASAVVAGLGQGLTLSAGLAAVTAASPGSSGRGRLQLLHRHVPRHRDSRHRRRDRRDLRRSAGGGDRVQRGRSGRGGARGRRARPRPQQNDASRTPTTCSAAGREGDRRDRPVGGPRVEQLQPAPLEPARTDVVRHGLVLGLEQLVQVAGRGAEGGRHLGRTPVSSATRRSLARASALSGCSFRSSSLWTARSSRARPATPESPVRASTR
jgi:MFS family permease